MSFLGIVVLCIMILGKAFYIQRVEGDHWRSMSDSMHQRIVELDADRGTIYSEDGQMLSTSLPQFDIYLDFQADGLRDKNGKVFRENIDSFAYSMAKFFNDKSSAQYKSELKDGYRKKSRYYALRKKLSFEEYKAFRGFPLVRLGRNKSGVIVEESSVRLSPFGLLANRTIGLSREHIESNGKVKKQNVGLEKSYDSLLTGRTGQRLVRYSSGSAIPIDGFETEPENGKDVFTTIDVNIQDIAENALLKQMESTGSQYGTCMVMETKTGKLKAIANLGVRPDGSYWEDDNYALRVTEPGSTIKLVTLLAALDKGTYKLNDQVEVGSAGRMMVNTRIVNDAEKAPRPVLTLEECFAHSSNVGMGKVAFKAFGNNPSEFGQYLHKYHMDTKSPVDLANVPSPHTASFAKNAGGVNNMITMAFGYALVVSPLQTLTLYNAVANDGKMMKPYLVNSIQQDGIMVKQFEPVVMEEQIASPQIIRDAQASMEMVVTEGTGKPAFKDMGFQVAGKTGTAHVRDGALQYGHGVYQASFVGYFPANEPQYTCIVVIRSKPNALIHYGGSLAGPVFREVAMKLYSMYVPGRTGAAYAANRDSSAFNYIGETTDLKTVYGALKVPFMDSAKGNWAGISATAGPMDMNMNTNSNTNANTNANTSRVRNTPVMRDKSIQRKVMPDVRGMGLRDALFLLENMGLKVTVQGKGKVSNQSIVPGSGLQKGLAVVLVLS